MSLIRLLPCARSRVSHSIAYSLIALNWDSPKKYPHHINSFSFVLQFRLRLHSFMSHTNLFASSKFGWLCFYAHLFLMRTNDNCFQYFPKVPTILARQLPSPFHCSLLIDSSSFALKSRLHEFEPPYALWEDCTWWYKLNWLCNQ